MRHQYYPALDGLRAAAILIVLLGHAGVPYITPHVGVDVFFTLSGFLITSLLISEYEEHGSISSRRFYIRRFLRLVPALWMTVAFVVVLTVALQVAGMWTMRDAVLAITYTTNWARTDGLNRVALPNGFVLDSPLGHTWSLAIEEQYYILWPLAISALCRRLADTRFRAAALGALFLTLVVYRIALVGHVSAERLYFGLDTHADGLVLGGAVAASRWGAPHLWSAASRTARLGALAIAVAVVLAALQVPWEDRLAGLVGFTATALAAAVFILDSVCEEDSLLKPLLTQPLLLWIGRVSYGLYLWHYPVYFAARHWSVVWSWQRLLVVGMPISLLLATTSYYLVERRFLRLKDKIARTTSGPQSAVVVGQMSLPSGY